MHEYRVIERWSDQGACALPPEAAHLHGDKPGLGFGILVPHLGRDLSADSRVDQRRTARPGDSADDEPATGHAEECAFSSRGAVIHHADRIGRPVLGAQATAALRRHVAVWHAEVNQCPGQLNPPLQRATTLSRHRKHCPCFQARLVKTNLLTLQTSMAARPGVGDACIRVGRNFGRIFRGCILSPDSLSDRYLGRARIRQPVGRPATRATSKPDGQAARARPGEQRRPHDRQDQPGVVA